MSSPIKLACSVVAALVATLLFAQRAEAQNLRVIPVPWVATDLTIPHQAYNGKATILKAVARGGNGTYTVEWDPEGDGSYNAALTRNTNNRYDLSASFTYPNHATTTTYQARVRVTSNNVSVVGTYPVRIFADVPADPNAASDRQLQVMRSVAVDNGLWYLHAQMTRSGEEEHALSGAQITGHLGNGTAQTAGYLWALGLNGHFAAWGPAYIGEMRDPADNAARFANDPYGEDAARLINFLLNAATIVGVNANGRPDESNLTGFYPEITAEPIFGTDDGFGIHVGYSAGEQTIYPHGHVLSAFSVMGMQGYVAQVGDATRILGRRFEFILQQMVDAAVYAQNECGEDGAWNYTPGGCTDDLSTGLWAITGLWHADEFARPMGVIVPNVAKVRIVEYIRRNANACPAGGTGGTYHTSSNGTCDFTTSAAHMLVLGWVGSNTFDVNDGRIAFPGYSGTTRGQLRSQFNTSLTFIGNTFTTSATNGMHGCWNSAIVRDGNFGRTDGFGNHYAMLHWQDAARAVEPEVTAFGVHNWFRQFSRYLINNTLASGNWRWQYDNGTYCSHSDSAGGEYARNAWAMLVLSPDAIPPLAIATSDRVNTAEGTPIAFNGAASDPGSGNPIYTWAFGNNATMGGQNVTYAYPDNGNFNVSLTSVSEGGTSTDTFPVTISNVAPTANAGADKVVNEGAAVAFDVAVTDPGTADTHGYSWNWADGTPNGAQKTLNHTYADNLANNAPRNVVVTVTDDDGGSGQDTVVVTVNNVAPTITSNPGANPAATEGQQFAYNLTFTDPGADTFTCSKPVSPAGSALNLVGGQCQFRWTPNFAQAIGSSAPVRICVTDDDAGQTCQDFAIAVSVLDVDNDGLPDSWEVANFGNTGAADQFGDPDQDGMNNLQEFTHVTNPQVYDGPDAPLTQGPVCSSEIATQQVTLVARNATDPQNEPLTYKFELYRDPAMTILVIAQENIAQGAGLTTSYQVPVSLLENTHYYWRVRAKDGFTFGPWSAPACGFFVNTNNEPPNAPRINSPVFGGQANSLTPVLKVDNALDPDEDVLTYSYEVYRDQVLSQLVTAVAGRPAGVGTSQWQVNVNLAEDTTYYWRARAVDPDNVPGDWSSTGRFFVTTVNSAPQPPVIVAPQNGTLVTSLRPELITLNANDADQDALVYDWQVATDNTFAQVVASGNDVPTQGVVSTRFLLPADLLEDNRYCWRVRADDTQAVSPWVSACFLVSAANAAPTVPVLDTPQNNATGVSVSPTYFWAPSSDPEGAPITYDVQVIDAGGQVVQAVNAVSGTTTSMPLPLLFDTTYRWRVRAVDSSGAASAFSALNRFTTTFRDQDNDELPDTWETANFGGIAAQDQFGDPDNDGRNNRQEYTGGTNPNQYDGPGAPTTNVPICGATVNALPVTLVAGNTTGQAGVALTYQFEVYSDAGMSLLVGSRDNIAAGANNTTSWAVNVNLTENRRYYWRVRAKDPFTYGPYSAPACSFFVNTANEAPGAPTVVSPLDTARVNSLRPTLTVGNTTDPDEDALTYTFQVYSDVGLTNLVASRVGQAAGANGQTGWQLNVDLGEDRTYYWRARAVDPSNSAGAFTATVSFFVSAVNSAPEPPGIVSPQNNAIANVLRPELIALNANDVDRDVLTYDWALARDAAFTQIVASASGAASQGLVSNRFLLAADLLEDTRYCWRVRASDGLLTSNYSTACFLVSAVNAPPTVPVVNAPANNATGVAVSPNFAWAPSTDAEGEVVTYDVQVLNAANQVVLSATGVNGTTTQFANPLLHVTTYRWQVRAVDRSGGTSAYSALASFTTTFLDTDNDGLPDTWEQQHFGNLNQTPAGDPDGDGRNNQVEYTGNTNPTAYDGPLAPQPVAPVCGSTVATLRPTLRTNNAQAPAGSPIRYQFELYSDPGLAIPVASIDNRPQGAGTTEWAVPIDLQENASYWWRVRAKDDFINGPWSAPACSFFVNVQNEAPGAPRINTPASGSQVNQLQPILTVDNTTDPDGDPLTYRFEVFAEAGLTNLVASVASTASGVATTSWQVNNPLLEDHFYYWRARATDPGNLSGGWSATGSFFVSADNSPPGAPTILLPVPDSVVPVLRPELAIVNGEDPDHDVLVYDWQLATDLTFNNVVASGADVPTQSLVSTRFQLPADLMEDTRYCWRARSDDGQAQSQYATACFVVSADNAPPTVPVLNNPSNNSTVPSLQPVFSWAPSTDVEGESITYDVQVLDVTNQVVAQMTGVVGTATLMPQPFLAETSYRWRARAVDASGGMSAYSATNNFATGFLDADGDGLPDTWETANFGNIQAQDQFGDPDSDGRPNLHEYLNGTNPNQYNGPGAPTPVTPACGSELANLQAQLVVNNAAGPAGLRYTFELYRDQGLSIPVSSQVNLAQGAGGTTSWLVPVPLTENTHYYWRARAKDAFTFGPYSAPACGFFVNTANEAPTAPRLNSPAVGGQVNLLRPTLVVDNATDPDEDRLTYTFEVYREPALSTLVASVAGVNGGNIGTTAWTVDVNLSEDRSYYWRVRATDPDGLSGGWTATGEFFVTTMNNPPEVPTISAPQDGAVVPVLRPQLIILDAADVDHDQLVYDWELATDNTFATILASGADQRQRVFDLVSDLMEDHHYCWRVRADDGQATSPYAVACFTVSAVNEPPSVPTLNNPSDGSKVTTLNPAFSWMVSTDPEGEPVTYDVEVIDPNNVVVSNISGVAGNVTATADDLEDGTEYTWHARAVDRSGGKSEWAPAQRFTVQLPIEDPDVTINGSGGCQVGGSASGSGAQAGGLVLLGLGLVGLARRRRRAGRG
jgi:MYXO-CTERM domain-containing protein